jgi:WXG100 family type VII secretion target
VCHRRPVQVTVEPDALADWSAHARRAGTRLTDRVDALDHGLAPLGQRWSGAAADGFATRHREMRGAVQGLVDTLTAVADVVETAHANYLAATSANARIWRVDTGPTAVVLHAMSAGRGRISADLEDVRTAVGKLVAALDDLVGAWDALARGLTDTAAMAGGDDGGSAFAADYDTMAAAAWQGWRSSVLMLDGIAGGLAATGNNLATAEKDSTATTGRPLPPITASTRPVPAPAPPPGAGADDAAVLDALTGYWPTADTAALRSAAVAWRTSAADLRTAVRHAFAAVDGLVAVSPDQVLQEVRRFTVAALSDDPTSGLTGVLAGAGGRIASACEGLADLTERTRARIDAVVAHYARGQEWYRPVADALDRVGRIKVARAIAAAGDAYLVHLDLSAIHDDHLREVASLRGELHPAGADRLARIATAMVPPRPEPANTCAVRSPDGSAGAAVSEAQRQALIAEVVAADDRIKPVEVLQITRGWDGRPVWISRGDRSAGLQHLLRPERLLAFLDKGVAPADIPGLALRAVAEGPPIGREKEGGGGLVYSVDIGAAEPLKIVVVESSNGFVVTAYPLGRREGLPL